MSESQLKRPIGASKLTDELPSVLADMVQVDRVTGVGVTVTGGADRAAAELLRLVVREIPLVSLLISIRSPVQPYLVENTVGVGASRTDGEEVSLETLTVRVDVEKSGSLFCQLHRWTTQSSLSCPNRRSWCPDQVS